MSNVSGIQANPQITLDQFRSLAEANKKDSLSLEGGQLQVGKRKMLGGSVATAQVQGRQLALDTFKGLLRKEYGGELANLTLSNMSLDNASKLKASKVRVLDEQVGTARTQLENRYLKPEQFDNSTARLASNVKVKAWLNEMNGTKDPLQQAQLLQQGITDVYNYYESKLGSNGAPATRDTVLQNPRWQEFSELVADRFKMTVVRPNFTAEEQGVRAQEASLMHAQTTQLNDVVKDEGKNWIDNGRTGSVQLLMVSAMLDTMNEMWVGHKTEDNADWAVDNGSDAKTQWTKNASDNARTVDQYGNNLNIISKRSLSNDTENSNAVLKPVLNLEAKSQINVQGDGNSQSVSSSGSFIAQAGHKAETKGVIGSKVAYQASHEHGAVMEGQVGGSANISLFNSSANTGSNLAPVSEQNYQINSPTATGVGASIGFGLEGQIGLYSREQATLTVDDIAEVQANLDAFAGAKGKADGTISFSGFSTSGGPVGMDTKLSASGFAGVEATANLYLRILNSEFIGHAVELNGQAKGMAGVGGIAEIIAQINTETIKFGASAAGSVGVGGGVGFGVKLNPLAMGAVINSGLSKALGRFNVELANVFDDKAVKVQNNALFNEVNTKLKTYLSGYEKEVDATLSSDVRFRDEQRDVEADTGLDKLNKFDQTGLQSKLLSMSEQELEQQKADKAKDFTMNPREHVFKSMDQNRLNTI